MDEFEGLTYGLVALDTGIEYNLMPESFAKLRERLTNTTFDDSDFIMLESRDGNQLVLNVEHIVAATLSTPETRRAGHRHIKMMKQEDFHLSSGEFTREPFLPE